MQPPWVLLLTLNPGGTSINPKPHGGNMGAHWTIPSAFVYIFPKATLGLYHLAKTLIKVLSKVLVTLVTKIYFN